MTQEKKIYDIAIIGGGPAGYTAGIYASRAEFDVVLFEGPSPGGQLTTTSDVENFPGFKEGISGPDLMSDMRDQAIKFGVDDKFELVSSIDISKRPFTITTDGAFYQAKTIIIATGAKAKYLGLENEKKLLGRGVSACATCDGFFFSGKEVVVVGGGDTAMEEANFLSKFATKVTLLNLTENFKASPIMLSRARKNPKVEIKTNVSVVDILGEEKVEGVILENTQTKQREEFKTDGVFVAIGRQPNTDFLPPQIKKTEYGLILTEPDTTKTNIKGIFSAGDVADTQMYWQAIVAAGSGCKAALDAQRFLEEEE
jgi:thioredoxin reductase (NADPH)